MKLFYLLFLNLKTYTQKDHKTMKKITKSTFKSFIKKNKDKLYILNRASFDGMVDGLEWKKNASFQRVQTDETFEEHTLGIKGVWLVGQSRDYFTAYNDEEFEGIAVSNCCGYFTVGIKK